MNDQSAVDAARAERKAILQAQRATAKAARLVAICNAGLTRKSILVHPTMVPGLKDVADALMALPRNHAASFVEEMERLLRTRTAKAIREAEAEKRFIARKKKIGAL